MGWLWLFFFYFCSLIVNLVFLSFSLRYLNTYVCMVFFFGSFFLIYVYFFFFLFFVLSRESLLWVWKNVMDIEWYRYVGWIAESGNYSQLEDHQDHRFSVRVLGYHFRASLIRCTRCWNVDRIPMSFVGEVTAAERKDLPILAVSLLTNVRSPSGNLTGRSFPLSLPLKSRSRRGSLNDTE